MEHGADGARCADGVRVQVAHARERAACWPRSGIFTARLGTRRWRGRVAAGPGDTGAGPGDTGRAARPRCRGGTVQAGCQAGARGAQRVLSSYLPDGPAIMKWGPRGTIP